MDVSDYKKNSVILKPDRDKHVRNKHPWVFMGAIASYPEFENGDILPVVTAKGEFVGYGYFHKGQSIAGRMFSFTDDYPIHALANNVKKALALRAKVIPPNTNAYRLINGEGDDLPGLIVDRYADVLVMQVNTLGMEKLKPFLLETLKKELGGLPVYEKSGSQTRRREGLEEFEGWIEGEGPAEVEIMEHGLKFKVVLEGSQKTGFFLDQREMRQMVRGLASGRNVLNCFSYTGGFSVYAAAGGAEKVDSVDISDSAVAGARENFKINNLEEKAGGFYTQDVLEFLHVRTKPGQYDFIILDPPAFAKRASDVHNASRGYTQLNQAAMEKLPAGGFLLTSSCSAHIPADLFQTLIFHAAKHAGRNVKIISRHVMAADHPVSLFYPEGDYLKSLLLYVE